jgi:hypothetical protein
MRTKSFALLPWCNATFLTHALWLLSRIKSRDRENIGTDVAADMLNFERALMLSTPVSEFVRQDGLVNLAQCIDVFVWGLNSADASNRGVS